MELFYLLLCCITFRTHLAFTKYQNFKTRFMLKVIKVYALKMFFIVKTNPSHRSQVY